MAVERGGADAEEFADADFESDGGARPGHNGCFILLILEGKVRPVQDVACDLRHGGNL